MRSFTVLAALLGVAMAAPFTVNIGRDVTPSGFTKVHPGGIDDIVITEENTLNATALDDDETRIIVPRAAIKANLPMKLVNNFAGGKVNAYIQGLDSDGHIVFIGAQGQLIYPSSGGSKTPVQITQNLAIPLKAKGQTLDFTLPIALSSGRIYFAEGNLKFFMVNIGNGDGLVQPSISNLQDPNAGVNFGFVEFTYTNNSLYANISYVDFVGMILGMKFAVGDGSTQTTAGLVANGVSKICADLNAQKNADGRAWNAMCIANSAGTPIRVLSPNLYHELNPSAFQNYWSDYVNQVWSKYSSTPLTINTQAAPGKINCRVSGDKLNCDGDNRSYAKPNAKDIWGCNSGPFERWGSDNPTHVAVIPRLCAAFTRTTLLVNGGNVQPSLPASSYYKNNPTNHYSRIVHKYEADGKGYAFSYDDVNPDGNENASGVVASGNPKVLSVYIGAPPS